MVLLRDLHKTLSPNHIPCPGSIKYTISKLTKQVHDTFTIDEDSGRVSSKATLDREKEHFYNFVVAATDELGRQGMCAVQVSRAKHFSSLFF